MGPGTSFQLGQFGHAPNDQPNNSTINRKGRYFADVRRRLQINQESTTNQPIFQSAKSQRMHVQEKVGVCADHVLG